MRTLEASRPLAEVEAEGSSSGSGSGSGHTSTSFSSVAVLYRTNAQSRTLERALLNQGVPHTLIHATSFFDRREIRDAMACV